MPVCGLKGRHIGCLRDTALRATEAQDPLERLNVLFLIDAEGRPTASIPLPRPFVATAGRHLKELASELLVTDSVDQTQDRVAELFHKYNLPALPVVDEEAKLTGIFTADDIISAWRKR